MNKEIRSLEKDTQIKKLLTNLAIRGKLSFVMHFSNIPGLDKNYVKAYSQYMYHNMFLVLKENYCMDNERCLILNRSHIGEAVYSPMYRNYSGDYVFEIENMFKNQTFFSRIVLFTMIDDPNSIIERDDGLSFSVDVDKKTEEIKMFKRAHEMSYIKHKLLINIANKTIDDVHQDVISLIQEVL